MKFQAIVCTDGVNANGDRMSKEAIEKLAAQSINIPVTLNFHSDLALGRVDKATVEDEHIVKAEGELITAIVTMEGFYVVPAVKVNKSHKEGNVNVIEDFVILSYGLTQYPADKNITPMKKIE